MQKHIICFALFISVIPGLFASSSIFPDLSSVETPELQQLAKKGAVSVFIGCGCEAVAQYLPIPPRYSQSQTVFSPKTVEGFGKVMIINGGKELVFASKELYERFVRQLPKMHRGAIDLSVAFMIYQLPSYIPFSLNDPYIELGGQGAALILYSYLGMRGFISLTSGLNEYLTNATWSCIPRYFQNKLPGYIPFLQQKTHQN